MVYLLLKGQKFSDDSPEGFLATCDKKSIENDGDFTKFISLPTLLTLRIESDIKNA